MPKPLSYYKAKTNKNMFKRLTEHDKKVVVAAKRSIMRKFETKYLDNLTVAGGSLIDNLGFLDTLTLIAQGTTINQRVGGSVSVKKIELNFTLAAVGAGNSVVRVITFWYKPDNGTLTLAQAVGAILSNGPSGGPDVNSVINYNNRLNFSIVKDNKYVLIGGASASNNARVFKYSIIKKLPKETIYTPTVNTGEHQLYTLFLSDQAPAAGTRPNLLLSSRTFFKDA